MGFFNNALGDGESLFKNEDALELEFVPKIMPYREPQQQHVANCIKPLLAGRNGRNIFIYGIPGIGKTAAIKWVFRDLEETTSGVTVLYINCWQKNTTYKIVTELCSLLGFKFTQNKNTEELFKIVKNIVNVKTTVFAFDEIDKAEDLDFLYTLLTDVYKKSIILITNYKSWYETVEERIKSRLIPEIMEFKEYNEDETRGILNQRVSYAFVDGVWDSRALDLVSKKASAMKDIRSGFYLLRESGLAAEEGSSKRILPEHSETAIAKIHEFKIKDSADLEQDTQFVLDIVKKNSGKKIGDLFDIYKENGGLGAYKTFQRRIEKLSQGKFVVAEKTCGKEGNTTIVSYSKKLTEF